MHAFCYSYIPEVIIKSINLRNMFSKLLQHYFANIKFSNRNQKFCHSQRNFIPYLGLKRNYMKWARKTTARHNANYTYTKISCTIQYFLNKRTQITWKRKHKHCMQSQRKHRSQAKPYTYLYQSRNTSI